MARAGARLGAAIRWCASSAGFERRFEATREFYRRLLTTALAARRKFIVGFLLAVVSSFPCTLIFVRIFSRRSQIPRSSFTSARRPGLGSKTRLKLRMAWKRPFARSFRAKLWVQSSTTSVCQSAESIPLITIRAPSVPPTPIYCSPSIQNTKARRTATSRKCVRRCRDRFRAQRSPSACRHRFSEFSIRPSRADRRAGRWLQF